MQSTGSVDSSSVAVGLSTLRITRNWTPHLPPATAVSRSPYWQAARLYGTYLLEGELFVGFDDGAAVAEKVRYVLDQELGGIMFWDFPGDLSPAQLLLYDDSDRCLIEIPMKMRVHSDSNICLNQASCGLVALTTL